MVEYSKDPGQSRASTQIYWIHQIEPNLCLYFNVLNSNGNYGAFKYRQGDFYSWCQLYMHPIDKSKEKSEFQLSSELLLSYDSISKDIKGFDDCLPVKGALALSIIQQCLKRGGYGICDAKQIISHYEECLEEWGNNEFLVLNTAQTTEYEQSIPPVNQANKDQDVSGYISASNDDETQPYSRKYELKIPESTSLLDYKEDVELEYSVAAFDLKDLQCDGAQLDQQQMDAVASLKQLTHHFKMTSQQLHLQDMKDCLGQ